MKGRNGVGGRVVGAWFRLHALVKRCSEKAMGLKRGFKWWATLPGSLDWLSQKFFQSGLTR